MQQSPTLNAEFHGEEIQAIYGQGTKPGEWEAIA